MADHLRFSEFSGVRTCVCGQLRGFAGHGWALSHVQDSRADSALHHMLSHSTLGFVHRAVGGFQEKGPNHAGSLNPRLRKGIMLLLLHSVGQSNHKVAEFQGLGNRLHPFMEGATKSHSKEGGYRKTADWVHQCSQNSHKHH